MLSAFQRLSAFALMLLAAAWLWAADLAAIPPLTAPVLDSAQMMQPEARAEEEPGQVNRAWRGKEGHCQRGERGQRQQRAQPVQRPHEQQRREERQQRRRQPSKHRGGCASWQFNHRRTPVA